MASPRTNSIHHQEGVKSREVPLAGVIWIPSDGANPSVRLEIPARVLMACLGILLKKKTPSLKRRYTVGRRRPDESLARSCRFDPPVEAKRPAIVSFGQSCFIAMNGDRSGWIRTLPTQLGIALLKKSRRAGGKRVLAEDLVSLVSVPGDWSQISPAARRTILDSVTRAVRVFSRQARAIGAGRLARLQDGTFLVQGALLNPEYRSLIIKNGECTAVPQDQLLLDSMDRLPETPHPVRDLPSR